MLSAYRQLAYHVFNIVEVFLDRVERDAPITYQALLSINWARLRPLGPARRKLFAEARRRQSVAYNVLLAT